MAAGIICEYNPFHLGHAYQLEETRRRLGDSGIVCVMSGNFVERGEPAIADKWVRTRLALQGGADLVLELPSYYATSGSMHFAWGAVALLKASGIVDRLSFGVEPGAEEILPDVAEAMVRREDEFEALLREHLAEDHSFAEARLYAIGDLLPGLNPTKLSLLSAPNAILGLEYLIQLLRQDAGFTPLMIPRKKSDYHSTSLDSPLPSSTALREALSRDEDIAPYLPEECQSVWDAALSQGLAPVCFDAYKDAFYQALSSYDADSLSRVAAVVEGLEHRLLKCAQSYPPLDELLAEFSTKRYPTARLRRILLHTLLGITAESREACGFFDGPGYIRVLGFRREKEELLGALSENSSLPVVTSVSKAMETLPEKARQMLADEIRFTDIYMAGLPRPAARGRGVEYRMPMVIV